MYIVMRQRRIPPIMTPIATPIDTAINTPAQYEDKPNLNENKAYNEQCLFFRITSHTEHNRLAGATTMHTVTIFRRSGIF